MTSTVDYALSAGPNCRAKHQLLRRYGAVAVGGVFDWQLTPLPAILLYLERDFSGLFELRDLQLNEWVVVNGALGTVHQHEFPPRLSSQRDLAQWYARARSRRDHVCATTRRVLRSGRPVLLAFSTTFHEATRRAFESAFTAYAGPATELRFVTEPASPDPALGWEGDSQVWDELLLPHPPRFTQWLEMTVRSMVKRPYKRPPRRFLARAA